MKNIEEFLENIRDLYSAHPQKTLSQLYLFTSGKFNDLAVFSNLVPTGTNVVITKGGNMLLDDRLKQLKGKFKKISGSWNWFIGETVSNSSGSALPYEVLEEMPRRDGMFQLEASCILKKCDLGDALAYAESVRDGELLKKGYKLDIHLIESRRTPNNGLCRVTVEHFPSGNWELGMYSYSSKDGTYDPKQCILCEPGVCTVPA